MVLQECCRFETPRAPSSKGALDSRCVIMCGSIKKITQTRKQFKLHHVHTQQNSTWLQLRMLQQLQLVPALQLARSRWVAHHHGHRKKNWLLFEKRLAYLVRDVMAIAGKAIKYLHTGNKPKLPPSCARCLHQVCRLPAMAAQVAVLRRLECPASHEYTTTSH